MACECNIYSMYVGNTCIKTTLVSVIYIVCSVIYIVCR